MAFSSFVARQNCPLLPAQIERVIAGNFTRRLKYRHKEATRCGTNSRHGLPVRFHPMRPIRPILSASLPRQSLPIAAVWRELGAIPQCPYHIALGARLFAPGLL